MKNNKFLHIVIASFSVLLLFFGSCVKRTIQRPVTPLPVTPKPRAKPYKKPSVRGINASVKKIRGSGKPGLIEISGTAEFISYSDNSESLVNHPGLFCFRLYDKRGNLIALLREPAICGNNGNINGIIPGKPFPYYIKNQIPVSIWKRLHKCEFSGYVID